MVVVVTGVPHLGRQLGLRLQAVERRGDGRWFGFHHRAGRAVDDKLQRASRVGAGDDRLIGGQGADVLTGGAGTDIADYSASAGGVTIDLAAGTGIGSEAQGDTLTEIENVDGSALVYQRFRIDGNQGM